MNDILNQLGLPALLDRGYARQDDSTLGRITRQDRQRFTVLTQTGEVRATLQHKNRFNKRDKSQAPVVGDWVELESGRSESDIVSIKTLVPRYSKLSRRAAGDAPFEQVLVANPDIVFVISGLDQNFNPKRIQRFLSMAWSCGLDAVLLLSKADIVRELDTKIELLAPILLGTPVYAVNMHDSTTLEAPLSHLDPGQCAALVGSSGVGKSTLVNQLLGTDQMATQTVRAFDDKGRHTTTHRELCVLPSRGGLIIDTPGMREAQIWYDEALLKTRYKELLDHAVACKFSDCRHLEEPDCAVRQFATINTDFNHLWRQYCLITQGMTEASELLTDH